MSQITTSVCDRCGVTKVRGDGKYDEPYFWDVNLHSSDHPASFEEIDADTGEKKLSSWHMFYVSWDLCEPCVTIAREALIAAVGPPHNDEARIFPASTAKIGLGPNA